MERKEERKDGKEEKIKCWPPARRTIYTSMGRDVYERCHSFKNKFNAGFDTVADITNSFFALKKWNENCFFFRVFVSEWVRWIMVPATENISLSHFGEQVRVHRIHTQKAQTINYIVHSVFYTLSYFSSFQPRKELTEYRMPMPTVCHLGE